MKKEIIFGLCIVLLVSGCINQDESVEEEPKHCVWVCISLDMTNFTNIQGCGESLKIIPPLSTCAEFLGDFDIE